MFDVRGRAPRNDIVDPALDLVAGNFDPPIPRYRTKPDGMIAALQGVSSAFHFHPDDADWSLVPTTNGCHIEPDQGILPLSRIMRSVTQVLRGLERQMKPVM
ncbi:MAG: hypothetical protein NXI27_21130 [Alphaproteobacteria bacterium]|nr:hypothetical protein [Alphaproteobacteria bacterium]